MAHHKNVLESRLLSFRAVKPMFNSTLSFVGDFMGLSLITDYQQYTFNSSRSLSLLERLKTPTFKALKDEVGPASFDWRMLLMMSVEEV